MVSNSILPSSSSLLEGEKGENCHSCLIDQACNLKERDLAKGLVGFPSLIWQVFLSFALNKNRI